MVKQGEDQDTQRTGLLKVKPSKAIIIIASVLLVVALSIFAIYRSQGGEFSSIALRIGDEVVFEDEYKDFVKSAKSLDIDEEEARKSLVSYHKNKIALDKLNVPVHQEMVDAQWDLVLGDISIDYISSQKYEDRLETPAGQVLAFNKYVDVLNMDGNGKIYIGSLYHYPYIQETKETEKALSEQIRNEMKSLDEGLSGDVKLIERQLDKTTESSASHSGIYLIREDGSATKAGGSFGLRTGLIPSQLTETLGEQSLPFVSDVFYSEYMGYYAIRVVDSFEVGENFNDLWNKEINKIRVVEYDR